MAQPAVDWVLLDFGGVVAEEGFREGLRYLAAHHGRDPERVVAEATEAVYASGYVTGTGSEAEFWRLLGERSGLWLPPLEGERAILARFRVRPWMLELVGRLRRAGLGVGLLTDQTDWLERLDRRDGFLAAFDRVYNSYRLGRGKRDPGLFDAVATDLGIAPDRILFVDDAPGNLERARSRGWRVLAYRSREEARKALEALLADPGARSE